MKKPRSRSSAARSASAKPVVRRHGPDGDDLLAEAADSCLNIETLGGLLAAAGLREGTDLIEVRLVANTGALIGQETSRLKKLLAALHTRMAK